MGKELGEPYFRASLQRAGVTFKKSSRWCPSPDDPKGSRRPKGDSPRLGA